MFYNELVYVVVLMQHTPCYKQAVTYRLVKAEKLIKTHHSEYGFNTACFITAGCMRRFA